MSAPKPEPCGCCKAGCRCGAHALIVHRHHETGELMTPPVYCGWHQPALPLTRPARREEPTADLEERERINRMRLRQWDDPRRRP